MRTSDILIDYKRSHPTSERLHEEAVTLFAANGGTHAVRAMYPYRPYVTHAKGSRKWDIDGNEYIDYVMGHGCLILGHSHPDVVRAVQEQVAKGVHFGENHELEIEWGKLVKSMMPWIERLEFFACGGEACMMALRLARIFTGRRKVLKFEEHFHGWSDQLMPAGTPGTLPEDNATNTVTIPSNNLDILEQELSKREYAVLMMEGGGGHAGGQLPLDDNFVRAVPDLVRKYGTLWVIDEVVTGFRDSVGGWQATLDVTPDLTALGKCISGGLAAGALVGRADIMEAFNPEAPVERRIRHSGTWNGNPLTASAGVAACKLLKTGDPQRKATEAAARLRADGNGILKERHLPGRLYGRSIVHIYIGDIDYEPLSDTLPPTKDVRKILGPGAAVRQRLCLHLLQRGVATIEGRMFFLSMAHTKDDVDQTVKALIDALDAMITERTLKVAR